MAVAAWCGAAPPVAPPRPVLLTLLRLGVVVDAAVSLLPARQLLRLAVGGVVLPSSHWLQLACLLIRQGSSARVGGTRSREQRRPVALLASCVEKKNKEEAEGAAGWCLLVVEKEGAGASSLFAQIREIRGGELIGESYWCWDCSSCLLGGVVEEQRG
ncbi:hypothetical protein PVAP13_2NG030486 [Panicum virgatum]|uniref:Uncharacterized protein n=1 Tax=Panicum virgatum TaxID=38727 RepID=A0A8T0V4Q7_PANVG|nr:hypothetical protein PVAP13_2NG030486 [Panicum virgatum]